MRNPALEELANSLTNRVAENQLKARVNARLRSGCVKISEDPQEYRVEAVLPPVPPHFPKEILVVEPLYQASEEPQRQGSALDPETMLARLDALAESIDRHRKQTRAALAMLGYQS